MGKSVFKSSGLNTKQTKKHCDTAVMEQDSQYKVRFPYSDDFNTVNVTEVAKGDKERLDWTDRPTEIR